MKNSLKRREGHSWETHVDSVAVIQPRQYQSAYELDSDVTTQKRSDRSETA